jgi:secreted trypsin-like serine protease
MPPSQIRSWILVGAAALALMLAASGTALAIANGTPVPDGHYPFATKLTMTKIPRADGTTYNSACSGALVAPQWIVTAGHCFHDTKGNRVSGATPYATTATVGRTDLAGTTGHVVKVVQVVQATKVDVALAKLASPVTDVAPLPLSTAAPKVGAILRVVGWGATGSTNPKPVTHLRTGQVKVKRVTSSLVYVVGYAPKTTTSACVYDSGAPYFSESASGAVALVSVESDGPACPHAKEETTVGIRSLASWIHTTTGS